jgi:hypothetical protein
LATVPPLPATVGVELPVKSIRARSVTAVPPNMPATVPKNGDAFGTPIASAPKTRATPPSSAARGPGVAKVSVPASK